MEMESFSVNNGDTMVVFGQDKNQDKVQLDLIMVKVLLENLEMI
jgi:hypothetical protein